VARQGTSDLTWGNRKFSGNSMRVRRDHLLYHGTLLYDFPLTLIEQCLGTPPRQPAYRGTRAHGAFLTNLPLAAKSLRQALVDVWQADVATVDWPRNLVQNMVVQKYSRPQWNLQGQGRVG
jgi:lipoate-protein ligase A